MASDRSWHFCFGRPRLISLWIALRDRLTFERLNGLK